MWKVHYFSGRVQSEIEVWPVGIYADFLRLIQLMQIHGADLRMPKEMYKPVALNVVDAIAKAKERPGFTKAWDALEEEYAALHALLDARKNAGLTQEALADRMGTTKSAISRLESSLRDDKHSPSFATLKKYAHACGKRLVVQLV
jgi:DNA-binding XRE family transcriptional regulator